MEAQNIKGKPVTANGIGARFIIAGGGTGGHIFPAIAIANAIREQLPSASFLFVGASGKMEMEKVPQAGYEIVGLTIAGFNRSSLIKNISLPFKLIKSFFQLFHYAVQNFRDIGTAKFAVKTSPSIHRRVSF